MEGLYFVDICTMAKAARPKTMNIVTTEIGKPFENNPLFVRKRELGVLVHVMGACLIIDP